MAPEQRGHLWHGQLEGHTASVALWEPGAAAGGKDFDGNGVQKASLKGVCW